LRNGTIYGKSFPKNEKSATLYGVTLYSGSRRDFEKALARLLEVEATHPALVFTPNLELLAASKQSTKTRTLLRSADLLLPDGIGTILLSRGRIRTRFPGIEAGEFLLHLAARRGYRVYLLGGKKGVAERAAAALKKRYPGLSVVGTHHGYFPLGGTEEEAVAAMLRDASPDLLIVCMGFPKQERFLLRIRNRLPSLRVGMALGGAIDVWSGAVRRAPRVMQRLGLEWLYRTVKEPKRILRLTRSLILLLK
jgi:N-acetylglucosaminyldiphosphoundecaprenol N-acetyl-beta-D-mannosaminyltransferase